MSIAAAGRPWLVGYLIVSATNLVAAVLAVDLLRIGTLVLAMPLLFGWFAANRPQRDLGFWLTTGALAFSWLGDGIGTLGLIVKLAAFLIGHLCYIALFWPLRSRSALRRPAWLVGYALVIGGALVWIAPQSGRLAPAVVAYGAVLGVMALLATGLNRVAAIGGALFVVSDLTIAVQVWVLRAPYAGTEVLIMSTYLAAQLLLVIGLVRESGSAGGLAPAP